MDEKYKLPTSKSSERRLKLDLLHGFGAFCSTGMRDSVAIIDDDNRKILFPIGKYFALKNFYKSDMSFIKLPEQVETILCMAISPNRKFLAVSERIRNDPVPQISIYNIKNSQMKSEKEKTFRYSDSKSEFIAIAFSHADARFLVCLTGPPDFQIIFLDIARMKPLGYTLLGYPVTRLTINPKESHEIGLSGPNCFKLLRVQENSFKNQSEIGKLNQNQNFTDHGWMEDGKIIVANDKGTIYICQKYDLLRIIQNGFNEPDIKIVCLTTFSKGFIVGSEYGSFALWVKSEENEDNSNEDDLYKLQKKWVAERKSEVCAINLSQNEDLLAVSFKSNDICIYEMGSIIPNSADAFENNGAALQKEVKYEYIFNGFHSGPITALDVCLQRPLIATCSKFDNTLRIWNYMNFKCELARKFYIGEESSAGDLNPLLSLAFHPSGYYLAAGFVDKLRFFHVLYNELKVFKEISCRQCSQVRFSHGGHFLAAAAAPRTKSTHYMINIYESYTTECIMSLKGHVNTVTDIVWAPNDQSLYTCGVDGGIYEFKLEDQSKKEYGQNNSKYSSIMLTPNNMILAAGNEMGKNIVREAKGEYNKQHIITSRLVQLASIVSLYNLPGIIGGSEYGQIKVYPSIFTTMAYETIPAHNGEVTKIRTSPDGRYVFSTGEDGAIFIFQVSEISSEGQLITAKDDIKDAGEEAKGFNPKAMVVDETLGDVVLVPRSDIENYLTEQKKLKTDLEDLESKMELKSQDEKKRLEREKQEAKEKMNLEIQGWSKRYEELKMQKSQIEKESNNLLKNMEATNLKAVEELENLYEKKLAFENEKFLQLKQELAEEIMKHEEKLRSLDGKNQSTLEQLQSDFRDKFVSAQKVYENTKQTADELKEVCEERLAQTEEEHELEISELKELHKKEVDKLLTELAELRSKNEIFKKESKLNNEEKERLSKSIEDKKLDMEKQESRLIEASSRIELLQKELEEREDTLKKKEKKIYEYKFKINDLQKSKHVLSFRTTEMRKSLEPKEQQIEKLKEELFKLEAEFEGMLKTSQIQNEKIKKMSTIIDTLTKNLKNQSEFTKKKESLIAKILMDIHNCVTMKDNKEWGGEMKNLYQKYVLDQEVKQNHQDPKGLDEMNRQIQHLEKSLDQMLESSQKIIRRRGLDIKKKTMENAGLIFDLNEIRKKRKELETDINNKATMLEQSKNENFKLKTELNKFKSQTDKNSVQGKNDSFIEKPSSPLPGQMNSLQFEKSDKKGGNNNLFPLNQKQKGEGNRGRIYKGPNFDSKTLSTFDKAKMMDLMIEIENSNQRLASQENQVRDLRSKIIKHIQEKGCKELGNEEEYLSDGLNE